MAGADVTVLLTVLNDARGVRAIEGLFDSSLRPRECLVADGGSRAELLRPYQDLAARAPFPVRVLDVPGSVAASREQAWRECRGPLIAFLDADEVPKRDWLASLVAPLASAEADLTAGPTEPLSLASSWDRYHAALDAWFYRNYVMRDVVFAPMGNTAWRRAVFEDLQRRDGHVFDVSLARGGEDFDVTVRALAAGFRGRFVPQAVLLHDYAGLHGLRRTLRKKYHYAFAEFQLGSRHAAFLAGRTGPGTERKPNRWRLVELLEPLVRRRARRAARRLET